MRIIKSVYNRTCSLLGLTVKKKREKYLKKIRRKNKNKSPSKIASNCNGTFMLHDLGLKFNTPFINLWIKPDDFIKLLKDIDKYLNADLVEDFEEGICYPIGRLIDIKIYFQHYDNFEQAKTKWNERKYRIDYNNLFILFTDRDGCNEDNLIEFDKLDFENKIVFVNRKHPNIKSSFYIKGFEKDESVGVCSDFMPHKQWKRFFDQFDYVKWFNYGAKV